MSVVSQSRMRRSGITPQTYVKWILLALVSAMVMGPLFVLVLTSFRPPGALPFQDAGYTLANYVDILTRRGSLRIFWNTLYYASSSVVLGITIAMIIAWLTERTNMGGRTLFRILMFSWMAVPPLVFGYGWILLINPGNGAINVLLMNVFRLSGAPLSPYSPLALIIISGLSLVPTAYVMISGLLRNMDPSLEDAGYVIGAARSTTVRKITLPLMRPGLLSVSIFLIMAMVQTFDLPQILGATAQFPVLSTRIYLLATPEVGVPNYGLAGALGVFLLMLALALMWFYFRAIQLAERFRTVTGKGFRPRRSDLGRWRPAAYLFVGTYFTVMILPLLILLWTSLLPYYRVPSFAAFADLSLASYAKVLTEPTVLRAMENTLFLVFISSTAVMALSCLISWFAVRSGGRSSRLLDLLSFLPTAVPPIVMAVAMLLLFMRSPIYGTIWVIIIGHIVIYLPFGTRTMNSAFMQIHHELEHAAAVCGATWMTGLRRVLVPLVWPHVLNAWLWVLAHSVRDLTFPLILLSSQNLVLASALYLRWDMPDQTGASAIAMILVVGLSALVVPIQIYTTRRIDRD
ncbi:iron ABC transporter permease [Fertoebacter nigrum]|uniref:Iron ABC transporter permease n=1 Tax=Fertoeibacter niger TaxID=2656921 RepID=A0A8X8KPU9_9RHOB|nr:iron ABC transporter permease [Fertoeibacter niger]NUB46475.1 iron ABC transporter permease [Fertoeibacter niger]